MCIIMGMAINRGGKRIFPSVHKYSIKYLGDFNKKSLLKPLHYEGQWGNGSIKIVILL